MDLSDESYLQIKCYKFKGHLYGSLNIVPKDSDSAFVLWNKYQIFLYENLNFEAAAKEFTPEFQISQLLVSNNYLVSVDCNGNVHTISLKFKNSRQRNFDISFQAREQRVLHCILYSPESALVLKHHSDDYYLCLHRMSTDFEVEKEMTIKMDVKSSLNDHKKYLLACRAISKEEFSMLSKYFEENLWRNHSLVLVSFDKLSVYACLFSYKGTDDVISLKKLYTSPSEICDMKIVDNQELQVIIILTCGTIVRLKLNNCNENPEVIHLNSAVSKLITVENSLIYTDGQTMWKAQNVYSKECINFQQFFVRDVKDFVKYGDQIICTTFSNQIYTFSTENKASFLKQDEDYCPAEKLVKNSDYLVRINEEIEKNNEIINHINNEGNYLTAVSLSRRQDIMDKIIDENVTVHENYEEVIQENSEITLTEELQEYFKTDSIILLINISATTTVQHSLSNTLNDIFENLKIHITLSTKGKTIKTTTVKLSEPLKKMQIIIPIERQDLKEINVEIKLISEIPGALNRKETIWTVLHRKEIKLHAEHFIKTNSSTNKNKYLKELRENIEELICKTAEDQHGHLFKIANTSRNQHSNKSPSFYVKLPHSYSDILKNENTYKKHFSIQKAGYIQKLLTTEEFLKSKIYATFEICKEKVYLEILNDEFSNPLLKISCTDMKIALDIRNFFGKIFHDDVKCSGEEFVSNALYTTTENIQKSLKHCSSLEDCLQLAERLQKNVIANLPL
ncbi:hypothetical protein NE865_06553 [Phthorimaea operculella]|nr:hypothetical protein NE865_06553 [Phthorimaea operculella]